ncbi:MAG: VOC family protein [Myxococcota bacterium]
MDNPSILSHVSVGTNHFESAIRFYDAALSPLGAQRIFDEKEVVAYGKQFPEFWVHAPYDGHKAKPGNGTHVAFFARSRAEVDAFHAAALKAGGKDEGPPGERPQYGPQYYGCYIRDLDGNKIEATFWDG